MTALLNRWTCIRGVGAALLVVLASGCEIRKEMYDQAKYEPLTHSDFFGDGRASRPLVEGTVARGFLREDAHLHNGTIDGEPAATFPFPVTREVMLRGHERFNIYCAPCHDRVGTGNGIVVQRGFKQPNSYHIDRLRESPPGYFYGVIKNGYGVMSSYAFQVNNPEDRWAIVAYIRALQLSQNASMEKLLP